MAFQINIESVFDSFLRSKIRKICKIWERQDSILLTTPDAHKDSVRQCACLLVACLPDDIEFHRTVSSRYNLLTRLSGILLANTLSNELDRLHVIALHLFSWMLMHIHLKRPFKILNRNDYSTPKTGDLKLCELHNKLITNFPNRSSAFNFRSKNALFKMQKFLSNLFARRCWESLVLWVSNY